MSHKIEIALYKTLIHILTKPSQWLIKSVDADGYLDIREFLKDEIFRKINKETLHEAFYTMVISNLNTFELNKSCSKIRIKNDHPLLHNLYLEN